MPSIVVNHEPQISRDDTVELFKAIARIFVQIFISQIHDFDRKLAAELSQTRNDSQKLTGLAVSGGEHNATTTVVEAGV
jgi:hypothetical protein